MMGDEPSMSSGAYIWINFIILIVNVLLFIYQRYDASKLRKIAIKDDFWFRSIALPIVIVPLQKFSESQTRKLIKLKEDTSDDENAYQRYFDNFQLELNVIMNRCDVMRIHSLSLYNELIRKLETMEDKVSIYCYKKDDDDKADISSLFFVTHTEIISVIMKFHDENKFL